MKGFKRKGKFVPTGSKNGMSSLILMGKPTKDSEQRIMNKHAPSGIFRHRNPRTKKIEDIRLSKIDVLNNSRNEHVLVGKGSDGRPVTKIVR